METQENKREIIKEILKKEILGLREILMIILKVIFLGLGIYYLFQGERFKVSFFDFLKYIPILGPIQSFFDKISIMVIIIPMSIVGLSLLSEDNKKINLLSKLFTVGGIFTFIPYFSKIKNMEEKLSLGSMMTIFNNETLEQKEAIYKSFLNKKLTNLAETTNLLKSNEEMDSFILYSLKESKKNAMRYITDLKGKKADEIENYSTEKAYELLTNYLKSNDYMLLTNKTTTKVVEVGNVATTSGSNLIYYIVAGLTIVAIATSVYLIYDRSRAKEGAELQLLDSIAIKKTQELGNETSKDTKKLNIVVEETQKITKERSEEFNERLDNQEEKTKELGEATKKSLDMIVETIEETKGKIDNLEEKIDLLETSGIDTKFKVQIAKKTENLASDIMKIRTILVDSITQLKMN